MCGQPRKKQKAIVQESSSEEKDEICDAPREKYQVGKDEDAPVFKNWHPGLLGLQEGKIEGKHQEDKLRNSCIKRKIKKHNYGSVVRCHFFLF